MERNNFTPESFMPYLSTGCKSAFLIAIVLCLSATQALAVTTYEGILTVVLFGSPPAQGGAVTNVQSTNLLDKYNKRI